MKRLLAFMFLAILFAPAASSAAEDSYSFRTEEFVALREMVDNLEDNEDVETTVAEKAALTSSLQSAILSARSSLDRVRNTERARLETAYNSAVTKINTTKTTRLTRSKQAIDKWCARKKRGKSESQQATVQKKCDTKWSRSQAAINTWATNKTADVEKKFGKSSRAWARLDSGYNTFSGYINDYASRGEASIAARPYPLPVNTVLPVISGTTAVGQTLTTTTGTWTSSPPATYTYQWQRCNTDATGCVNITGATSASYTLTGSEASKAVRVIVTATNAPNRFDSATSALTASIAT